MGSLGERKFILSFIVLMMFTFSFSIRTADSQESGSEAVKLFERKCNLCHSVEKPKSKRKSMEGWRTTVMRMKNKNGCPLTDEEADVIINYLSEAYGK